MASQVLSTPQEPSFTSIPGPVRRNTKRIAMGHRHPDWVSSPKRCNISFGYQKLLDGQRNSNKYQDSIHLNRCWSATNHRYPQVIQSWPRGTLGLLPHGFRKLFLDRWAGHGLSSQGHEVIFPKDTPVVWETAANGVPGAMVSSGIKCFSNFRNIKS